MKEIMTAKLMKIISILIVIACGSFVVYKMTTGEGLFGGGKNKIQQYFDISKIDKKKTPLFYDFVNGSYGLNYDHATFQDQGAYYIAMMDEKNDPDNIYISYYPVMEGPVTPTLGSIIYQYKVGAEHKPQIQALAKNLEPIRNVVEDGKRFMIVNRYKAYDSQETSGYLHNANDKYYLAGYDVEEMGLGADTVKFGKAYDDIIVQGQGWPTEWLRRELYSSKYAEKYLKIRSDFWDRHSYMSITNYHKGNEKMSIKVVGYDDFIMNVNNEETHLGEMDYDQLMAKGGWTEDN